MSGVPPTEATVTELKSGWSDKRATAEYFACSVRQVEKWIAAGMPHSEIGSRIKLKPAEECEPWLEQQGLIKRRGRAA